MSSGSTFTTSWDDGHPLDQRIAELLAKYGLTGTFYIPIRNSRRVMTAPEIRHLSENFEIGAHTTDHLVLTDLTDEVAEKEIRGSREQIQNITGRTCETFCFPRGLFHCRHLAIVRHAGFRCARTVELLSTQFPAERAGVHLIPTTIQAAPHHWSAYVRNCAKRLAWRNFGNFVLHVRSRDWPTIARSMLRVVARRGGVFHLWGHSWEVEEHHQWPQLEEILREMQQLRSVARCVTNSRLAPAWCVASGVAPLHDPARGQWK